MIVFHHNDPDGRCAAAIVLAFHQTEGYHGEIDFVELNHHTNDFRTIEKDELVYIVDYSFPPDIMNKILKVTSNVVLIDHHKTTQQRIEEYVGEFEMWCEFDGSNSGCMLAWDYFFGYEEIPWAVRLISDYDAWVHAMKPDSTFFVMGLGLFDCRPESKVWHDLLLVPEEQAEYTCDDIIQSGRTCVEFRDNLAKAACDEFGFETEYDGCRCFAIYCTALRSSLFFGDRINQYDMCIMIVPHKNGCTLRFYSNGEVDVSEIAKKYGGGGHKGAGGCTLDRIPSEFLVERKHG